MTALCGGGASGPKSGIPQVLAISASAAAAMLQRRGAWWAIALAPLVGELIQNAADFCATDPPADPNFTPGDAAALLAVSDPTAFATALGKLKDLVLIAAWHEFCECKTVPTPDPGAIFSPPATMPALPPATASPCWHASVALEPPPPYGETDPTWRNMWLAGGQVLPRLATRECVFAPGYPTFPGYSVQGLGWQEVQLAAEVLSAAPDYQITTRLGFWDTAGAAVTQTAILYTQGTNTNPANERVYASRRVPVPAGAAYVGVMVGEQITPPNNPIRLTLDAWCGGGLPGTPSFTCAPDPTVLSMLDAILRYVVLIQRQHVPFAYVPKATHTGLSGTGEIAVQGLLGVTVGLGVLPSWAGYTDSTPDYLHDVGYVTPGTPDGWQMPVKITANPTYVRLGGEITRLGYSFSPGVVATITEQAREP